MVHVSGEVNQCEATWLVLVMKGKQSSSGDGSVDRIISVEVESDV
jgi:hypothetical protein